MWEPASINGSNPKYSVSLIIPKSDKQTLDAINAAVDAAIKEGVAKFGGKIPNKAALKLPLRDGDTERDDEAYPSDTAAGGIAASADKSAGQRRRERRWLFGAPAQPPFPEGEADCGRFAVR